MPKSATIPAMSATKPNAVQGTSPGDKYSALKELDELFSQPTPAQSQQAAAAPSWMPPAGRNQFLPILNGQKHKN